MIPFNLESWHSILVGHKKAETPIVFCDGVMSLFHFSLPLLYNAYVNQQYKGNAWTGIFAGAEFSGINIEAVISF